MIPKTNGFIDSLQPSVEYRNKTYRIDNHNKNISGFVDGVEALKQTIYGILNTERYEYLIYSFDYGVELQSLIGEDMEYVKIDIHRRIEEALKQDNRILSVDKPEIISEGDTLTYKAVVNSIYGDINIEKEVM